MNTAFTLSESTTENQPQTSTEGLPDYTAGLPCAWAVADVANEDRWIFRLTEAQSQELIDAVRRGRVEGNSLLDYRQEDFDLKLSQAPLDHAFNEVRDGRGMQAGARSSNQAWSLPSIWISSPRHDRRLRGWARCLRGVQRPAVIISTLTFSFLRCHGRLVDRYERRSLCGNDLLVCLHPGHFAVSAR